MLKPPECYSKPITLSLEDTFYYYTSLKTKIRQCLIRSYPVQHFYESLLFLVRFIGFCAFREFLVRPKRTRSLSQKNLSDVILTQIPNKQGISSRPAKVPTFVEGLYTAVLLPVEYSSFLGQHALSLVFYRHFEGSQSLSLQV